jgi:acyl-[acyl-carrier-protein]-phospholipid O-acyltransferase/long-chain-fatty-acid--[acyl-carrier-protein] ligase
MATGNYLQTLKQKGFLPFFWTQFLGAFNDNFYKIVVSMFAIDAAGSSSGAAPYLALIGALFILPFFLFSGYAGHVADAFSKRSVLVVTKAFEIVAMVFALLAFFSGHLELTFCIVFLMALQSTFFSPAKYGILPEMLPQRDLSRGNGLLEMSTFLAIILGTAAGSVVFGLWKHDLGLIGLILILIAVLGTITSFGIPRVPPSGATKPFQLNPWTEVNIGVRRLYQDPRLWLTVMGISYFWFVGALMQMDILLFGKEILALDDLRNGLLVTFLAFGIGIGSLAAGRLSGDKVELGLVPLGSLTMALFSFMLYLAAPSYTLVILALILLGFSGGLFAVPLNALLQQRSGKQEKGQLIATNNFLNTLGVLLASGMFWTLAHWLRISPERIVMVLGLFTAAATVYMFYALPEFVVRFVLWLLTHTLYRIRIVGHEHVPFQGPALLVSNHVSFVDALLIGASVQRFIRFMLHRDYYEIRGLQWFFRLMNAIPVSANNRRDIVDSLKRARKELAEAHVVCIFPEGQISRTGHLLLFKRGLEKITDGIAVPIIPVHLDQIWGSIFSFKDSRFFWKWPQRIPYPVTVSFGPPLPPTATTQEVRQAVLELGSDAAEYRRKPRDLLHGIFIRKAKRHWRSLCLADTGGIRLNYGRTLIGAVMLSRWVKKHCANDRMVGVILPASVAGALANIAVLLAGKVPVNLNFTSGADALTSAIEQCGITTILTSRVFVSKAKIEERPAMAFVEDIRQTFSPLGSRLAAALAFLAPSRFLEHCFTKKQQPHELATVIFSSGSTGVPKGVMLSHHNIISNIESVCQIIPFTGTDRMMGVLPLFHSFGFSVSLWLPLITGFSAVFHPNPMDAKTIGETVQEHKATLLVSTPTFFAAYVRRCSAEEFATLRYSIAGAEKLRPQVARGYKDKFGMDLLEGYGCTEMAPVISVNIPDVIHHSVQQIGHKSGTVGHPIPGVAAKVIDPDTASPLPCGQEGLLLVKGPNRMLGYLGQPELTKQVLRDDWYVTGDIAAIDGDGFIRIADRISRFSKIGGEMVPHTKIEESINKILGHAACVVTAVSDEQKGERLVALYSQNEISPDALWAKLQLSDLPKLWIPKRENFYWIESIPLLGAGKVDLKAVRRLATEKAGQSSSSQQS